MCFVSIVQLSVNEDLADDDVIAGWTLFNVTVSNERSARQVTLEQTAFLGKGKDVALLHTLLGLADFSWQHQIQIASNDQQSYAHQIRVVYFSRVQFSSLNLWTLSDQSHFLYFPVCSVIGLARIDDSPNGNYFRFCLYDYCQRITRTINISTRVSWHRSLSFFFFFWMAGSTWSFQVYEELVPKMCRKGSKTNSEYEAASNRHQHNSYKYPWASQHYAHNK